MDYEQLEKLLTENMPYAVYCDITDTLSINNYYRTDMHWLQEEILPAARKYDFEKLYSRDPYEFFLSGAAAVLTIENPFGYSDVGLL